jgi:hypothetical protein
MSDLRFATVGGVCSATDTFELGDGALPSVVLSGR